MSISYAYWDGEETDVQEVLHEKCKSRGFLMLLLRFLRRLMEMATRLRAEPPAG